MAAAGTALERVQRVAGDAPEIKDHQQAVGLNH
jgi:hypothetical protein